MSVMDEYRRMHNEASSFPLTCQARIRARIRGSAPAEAQADWKSPQFLEPLQEPDDLARNPDVGDARSDLTRPSLVICRTTIGYGSPGADTATGRMDATCGPPCAPRGRDAIA